MNYLELVNTVIQESGVDLDELTSVNFASPPRTVMYDRIKRWVNRSYKEILQKREEWHTLQERTVQTIYPRIRVDSATVTVAVNDEYQGRDSGVRFLVKRITTDPLDPDADIVLDITYSDPMDNRLDVGEYLNRIAPTAVTNAIRMEGFAGYDFQLDIPTVKEVNLKSIQFQSVPNSVIDDNLPGMPMPVYEVVWDDWGQRLLPDGYAIGQPQLVTRGPDGLIQFWPRLDKPYSVIYNYSRTLVDLAAYNDIPRDIPADLHMIIAWRAIMKYARFDNKDKLWLNARDEYRFYNNKMEENKLPELRLGANRYWA